MFPRLARFLVLIAAVQILGGHWAVLQTVAWAKMIVDYAQRDSLGAAVVKTFDGRHPCGLCKVIEKGKGNDQRPDSLVVIRKVELFYAAVPVLVPPQGESWLLSAAERFSTRRVEQPAVPPPRRAVG